MKKWLVIGLAMAGVTALGLETAHAASLADVIPEEPRNADLRDIIKILVWIINWALAFAAGIAAVFIVVNGYQYVLAAGNPEKLEKAKMGLTWAITGFILAISAYAIVLLLQQTLGAKQVVTDFANPDGPDKAGNVLTGLIQLVLAFGGAVAVLFMILGGFRYITSGGNPELADKAKKTLLYSVIGLTVVMSCFALLTLITNTLDVRPALL